MPDSKQTYTVTGRIISGPLRGKPLIDLFFYQITSVLGFQPFKGTLDIKVSNPVDVKAFATKTVDRILLDGKIHVDLFIAAVILVARKRKEYIEIQEKPVVTKKKDLRQRIEDLREGQKRISAAAERMEDLLATKEERFDCYVVQQRNAIDRTVLEIIGKENFKEKYSLKDGDLVDIIFYEKIPGQKNA